MLALEKSRQLEHHFRNDCVVLFFLSMAHGRLNEKEQAAQFFDQAAHWRLGILSTEEELRRLCAEAADLLGVEVPPALREPPVLTPGPTLLIPAARATLDNGTFDRSELRVWDFGWSDVPGATQYQLYVSGPKPKVPLLNVTLTATSYRYETNGFVIDQNRRGHRWKVRAMVNDTWSDWSEERTFDVAPVGEKKPPSPR